MREIGHLGTGLREWCLSLQWYSTRSSVPRMASRDNLLQISRGLQRFLSASWEGIMGFRGFAVCLFLGETGTNKCLITPGRVPMSNRKSDCTRVQRAGQWVYWGYFQDHGWPQGGSDTEKLAVAWGMSHKTAPLKLSAQPAAALLESIAVPLPPESFLFIPWSGACESCNFWTSWAVKVFFSFWVLCVSP